MIFNFYKPLHISSFQALSKFKKLFGVKRIGHLGTLDPLAEGVLPLCIGDSTKLIPYIELEPKSYVCEIFFGFATPSFDREGIDLEQILQLKVEQTFVKDDLESVLQNFIGEIDQVPPVFSAVKVDGVRSYELARKLEIKEGDLTPKKVKVFDIQLLDFHWPIAKISIECGGGFYVRGLVRDLAIKLKIDAFMLSLIRTKVGHFDLTNIVTEADFENGEDHVTRKMIDPQFVLKDFYRFDLTLEQYQKVKNGIGVPLQISKNMIYAYYCDKLVSVMKKKGSQFVIERNL